MANAPVNIVYPVESATYPISDPTPNKPKSAYVTFSFSLTLGGELATVTWGVDRTKLGEAKFYDQYSTQQVWKLRGGIHRFWVRAKRGGESLSDAVTFAVGT